MTCFVGLDTGVTAINWQDGASNIACFVGGEEDCGSIELARFAIALHWNVSLGKFLEAWRIEYGLREFSLEVAWADCITSNAVSRKLGGHSAREVHDRAL